MANSYHMEALRKQRLLDRKNEALRRLEKQGTDLTKDAVMDGYLSKQTPKESPLITDEGQFNQQRCHLPMFRVNEEGLKNRYRNRQELAPHCDKAFALLYPGNDNSDYTCDVNQNNRRMNIMSDKYNILNKVNGPFHVQVLRQTPE
ncbi:uncharacterized protein LOC124118971 isoform X1 [Haliotis rufescens]|uniref:uncharacterized protein LOC124118971 isoform X1 n=1 Tax=Haliotis rufescens TaxID=6454 RepID=UPI00201E8066|nr:uncharacterized protein LOC124118971 isoform X1 [Haliotis rufescens]